MCKCSENNKMLVQKYEMLEKRLVNNDRALFALAALLKTSLGRSVSAIDNMLEDYHEAQSLLGSSIGVVAEFIKE